MIQKKKTPTRHLWRILIILFIIFMALYIAMQSGYYHSGLERRVELTREQILQFEQDVRDGKEVDLTNYLTYEHTDYSSRVSQLGMNLSNSTERFMTRGIGSIFRALGRLFT